MNENIFALAEGVVQEEERDVIGGQKLDTDIYPIKLNVVYLDRSKGGAHNINIVATVNGQPYNETVYFTNREGKNTYQCKNTGKPKAMPGFSAIDNMCKLLAGKPFAAMAMEDKTIKVYDYDTGKDLPVSRKVLTELVAVDAFVAIQKITQNKQVKSDSGKYVNDPTGATRDSNEIVKWFNADKCTLPEQTAGAEAEFYEKWLDANKGKVKDKVEKVAASASAATPSTASLFDKG